MLEIFGLITTLINLYPFTLTETIVFIGLAKGLWGAVMNQQWKKAEQIVVEEALPLVGEYLSNEEKRDIVVKKLWSRAPKALRVFATPEQMEKIVDQVYVNVVKPKVDRDELLKVSKPKNEDEKPDSIFHFGD